MKVIEGIGGASEAGWHKIARLFLCEKEYQYAEVRGITKPLEYTPDHFAVGSIFHAGRAKWFARGFSTSSKTWNKIVKACEEEEARQELPVTFRASKIALTYLKQYIDYWSMRPCPKPVATEYLLKAKIRPSDPVYAFRTCKLDDFGYYNESDGQLAIGESKTTSDSIHNTVMQYTIHGQTALQYMLWKSAPEGEAKHGPVAGTILDVTKKGYGGRPCSFARVFIPFEERMLDWFHESLVAKLKRASEITWNSKVERNITSCTRIGGRGRVPCDYLELCAGGRSETIKYVMKNGQSLMKVPRTEEKWVRPWV